VSLRDLVRDTLATIWAHKLRTGLTMFGIAWGILSITLMVAAGEGLRVGQRKQAETMGRDIVIVFAGRTSLQAGGLRAGKRVWWRDFDAAAVEAEAPTCNVILPEMAQSAAVRSRFNSATLQVSGSMPPFAEYRSLDVAEGRFYNWSEAQSGERVAFLGADVRKQLFGDRPALGENITLNGFPYRVIGIMQLKAQNSDYNGRDITKVFVPLRAVLRDIPRPEPAPPRAIDQILLAPSSVEQHDACVFQARRTLARIHRFDVNDKEAAPMWDTFKEAAAFRQMTDGMKYFLGAVGVVTLLLGGIGVMNVMLVAVRERTREIGVRKAVGATSGNIVAQFFLETVLIAALSGGLGLTAAYALCAAVNTLPMPPFFAGLLPTWSVGLLSVGLLAVIAVLAAVYPASRAAAVDPIEALRFEAGG
jgi:putative ABC transport system permease protein